MTTFFIWYFVFASIISLIAMRRDKEMYVNEPHAFVFFFLGVLFAPLVFVYLVYLGVNKFLQYLMSI